MYKYLKISILFITIFTMSCNNDLNLTASAKEIPVVYGLLSRQDTAHYIRIERAFLDAKKAATELAQIPDSLYYKGITVQITKLKNNQSFALTQVDGTKEGYPRDKGTFVSQPNYLYKIKASVLKLEEGDKIRFTITKNNQLLTDATTTVVKDLSFLLSNPPNPVTFKTGSDLRVGWKADAETAKFFDLKLILKYDEARIDNATIFEPKTLEWIVEQGVTRTTPTDPAVYARIPGIEFYKYIAASIDANKRVPRKFKGIDFIVEAGGSELYDYINIGSANLGITGTELIPTYSNLSNGGRGIFSSRNRATITDFNLSKESLDSLKAGSVTKQLNFQ